MAKKFGPYTRITGLRRMVGTMASIWQGPGYLIQISSTGYTENYLRFYLRDVQGFLIQPSSRRSVYNAILLGGIVPFGLIGIGVSSWIPVSIAGGILGALALWNSLKGPACNLSIVTRVQTTRLEAIGRRRTALRFIEAVRGMIEEAQRDLAPQPDPVPPVQAIEEPPQA